MHSASAMADTNMEKKDFARRRRKSRRAKRRRENLLFRRTKQHFRRAITCRQQLFCATNKFLRRTKIPSREYNLASRKVHDSSRQLKYFVAQGCTAITLYATTYFRRAKTHVHIGAKIKLGSAAESGRTMVTATRPKGRITVAAGAVIGAAASSVESVVVEAWIRHRLGRHGGLASRTLASNHGCLEGFG
ncbi:hypothetical protein L3X38_018021 [Prunus dulcis]|uniref:Uncharacterized protein n=1 Tax=Prunus dulcis TaxID=3755 RepID=A0AAD4WA18_PRUDU|nr:hypothetical protein L3X38_018021 [Prunus dulcis]